MILACLEHKYKFTEVLNKYFNKQITIVLTISILCHCEGIARQSEQYDYQRGKERWIYQYIGDIHVSKATPQKNKAQDIENKQGILLK